MRHREIPIHIVSSHDAEAASGLHVLTPPPAGTVQSASSVIVVF